MTVPHSKKLNIKKVRAIFLCEGKILVVPSTRKQGFFALPGGHVEDGETSFRALQRELQEELSVQVGEDNVELLGTFPLRAPKGKGSVITDLYLVHAWQGTLTPSGNIESMQWVASDDLKKLNTRYNSGMLRHVVPALKKRKKLLVS